MNKKIRQGSGKTVSELKNRVARREKNIFIKILIPYDATQSSERALKKILPILEKHSSKIVLLTCIRDKATFGFFKTNTDKKMMRKEKEKAKKIHHWLTKKIQELGMKVSSKIVKSDLESKTIISQAKKERTDLIIMSKSRLKTNAEKIHYNSTVEAVFTKTPCAFLYIP